MVGEWVFESEMDMGVGMEFPVHKIKYGFWNQNKRNVVEFTSYRTFNDLCNDGKILVFFAL
jgi:hypothetical protein